MIKKVTLYALYDNEKLLINSIKNFSLKYKQIIINEVYSPYPIHGLDKLLCLKKTNLSILSFFYGLFGFLLSNLLIWYTMIYDWPQNIGGKPSFSWINNFPSFVPVIFEATIFFSAHFMCITYLIQCNLFPGNLPKNPNSKTTDNMFIIEVTHKDIKKLSMFFINNGAKKIELK